MREEFSNKIKIEEKNINEQIFKDYFFYQTLSYLAKSLHGGGKIKNDEIIKHINNGIIELRNSINSKEIPENENPKKVVNIVEKIFNFNKQQKSKGNPSDLAKHIKILTPNHIL